MMILGINMAYQALTTMYSPNPTQQFVNNMYWASSGLNIFLISLTFINRRLMFLMFPVSTILCVRNVFRLLDFENSKYLPGGGNPFAMPLGTWGYLCLSQLCTYMLCMFIQINSFEMISGSKFILMLQFMFGTYCTSAAFEASRVPTLGNFLFNAFATALIYGLLIYLTRSFPVIMEKVH